MAQLEEGCKVLLNVYDLSQGLARQLSTTFLGKAIEGIWHTGIVVFGNEYYFGGGIQSCPEGQTPYGRPVKVVDLGYTEVPKEVFEDYLQDVSPRYTAQTYSLLRHNCNNFSEEVSQFLCGVGIPDFILKVPEEVMNSPMGALIMPMIEQFETTLRYGGVPQVPHAVPHAGPTQLPSLSEMPAFPDPLSIPGNGNGSASQRLPSTGAGSASALVGAPMHSASRQTGSEKTAEKSVTDPKMSTTHDELAIPHAVPHAGPTQLLSLSEMPALPAPLSIPGNGNGSASQRLPSTGAGSASALVGAPTHSALRQTGSGKTAEKSVTDPKMSTTRDELAKARVQEEITREFAALMAEGRLRASEAAAIATRRVIERHGRGVGLSSQS